MKALQERVGVAGFRCEPIDGIFRKGTEQAVCRVQITRNVDGRVGLQTRTALLPEQPPTASNESPVKVTQRPAEEAPKIPATAKCNSKGKAASQLQEHLNRVGFDRGKANGSFGARNEAPSWRSRRPATSRRTASSVSAP